MVEVGNCGELIVKDEMVLRCDIDGRHVEYKSTGGCVIGGSTYVDPDGGSWGPFRGESILRVFR